MIFSDEIIERLIDLVSGSPAVGEHPAACPERPAWDTEKRLANLLEAIEQGTRPRPPSSGWTNCKPRKEALNTSILEEELKKPVLTREWDAALV